MNSRWQRIKKRLKYNPLGKNNKRQGVALILAVTSLLFMVYIAKEVSRDSLTEYVVNSHELNRLKAYYAARNGMDIALLRIKVFQQASRFPLPPAFAKEIDQIWKFPFAWPLPAPPDMNSVDRENMDKMAKESLMDATYTHTIEDEGSKIDVNDLISPSKTLRDVTKKQILTIFENKIETDEDFRIAYQNFRFDDLVNRMIDFMSDVNESAAGGGGKQSVFAELGQSYPPNRGFRTVDEIRLIPGMTEEFFNLLSQQITIYGMKSINPNSASEKVLRSLDKGMTDEAVKEAIARRDDPQLGGPFVGAKPEECLTDFKKFVESRGARLSPEFDQIPMLCDKVINFRIRSTGIYGAGSNAIMKDIIAVVMDLNKSASQIKTFVDKEKKEQQEADGTKPNPAAGPKSPTPAQTPLPKGVPRVVYWSEN